MKTLLESLLDNKKDITGDLVEDQIKDWIENNCKITAGDYKIFIKKNKYYVDVKGNIEITNKNIKNFPTKLFQFNIINGTFDCCGCELLYSLEGAPEKVENGFYCSFCRNLTSLKGAPKEVGGIFDCIGCKSLKTLEGSPKEVGGIFDCTNCYNLRSFKGLSPNIGKHLYIANCDKLINKYSDIEEDIRRISNINGEVVLSEEGY